VPRTNNNCSFLNVKSKLITQVSQNVVSGNKVRITGNLDCGEWKWNVYCQPHSTWRLKNGSVTRIKHRRTMKLLSKINWREYGKNRPWCNTSSLTSRQETHEQPQLEHVVSGSRHWNSRLRNRGVKHSATSQRRKSV
jgi:hypothetical protein